ncbi:MAG: aminotransferase class I/II-fold pyridoxal phosphate-dependent enzyme, partial [Chloroflexi bacterium]|nr:aminotransferase class I/II-fold pyridoxal phosphate-dependent enzyme [Chloroflexota bacterium]
DVVVNAPPTFGMYDVTAHICGGVIVEVERDKRFDIDVDGMLAAAQGAKLIVLASPNNPSGNSTPLADVERLLEADCLVVVDEAYAEFAGRSVLPLIDAHPNLVVLRTMSKWAGLAGLRAGYGVMNEDFGEVLMRGKPPYSVSQVAEAALLASLEDAAILDERARLIVQERTRMTGLLAEMPGVEPLPSDANFILCRLPEGRGRAIYDALADRGVSVRYYSRGKLADYLRVSAGTPEQTERFIEALRAARQQVG